MRILAICMLLVLGMSIVGYRQAQQPDIQEVTFEQLFSSLKQYNERYIALEGFYFDGFEVQIIAERLEYSGYAFIRALRENRIIT